LPIGPTSYLPWGAPPTNLYWFHRFLVVLCADLRSNATRSAAISRAQAFTQHEFEGEKRMCDSHFLISHYVRRILPCCHAVYSAFAIDFKYLYHAMHSGLTGLNTRAHRTVLERKPYDQQNSDPKRRRPTSGNSEKDPLLYRAPRLGFICASFSRD
jgi:hypothetical protein